MTDQPEPQPETGALQEEGDCCQADIASAAAPRSTFRYVWRIIWRVLVAIVGSAMVLAGLGLSLPGIPGPGFLVILAGLAILSTEFAAPRRLLRYLRNKVRRKKSPADGPGE